MTFLTSVSVVEKFEGNRVKKVEGRSERRVLFFGLAKDGVEAGAHDATSDARRAR
jgi:hypothetical protein